MKIRSADPPPRSGTGNQETSFRRCYLAVEPRALYARFPPRFSGHTLRSAWPSALRSEPRTLNRWWSIDGERLGRAGAASRRQVNDRYCRRACRLDVGGRHGCG